MSGSGIVAVDAGCTSSLRDPDSSSTYYARRHTFTLSAAATVSVWVGPASGSSYLVLSDSSGKVVGRDQGNTRSCYRGRCSSSEPARLDHLLLAAGTYTIEATKSSPGATGAYTVGARWAPADACSRSLGALGEGSSSLSGSGIVAVDAGCTSSLRDPDSSSTYYARRHTFTLSAAATVSVWVGPASGSSYLVLSDSSGKVVGRDQGNTRSCYRGRCSSSEPARLDHLLLAAGTYTIEATKSSPGATGAYTVGARWAPADACSRSLGALGEGSSSLSGSGIVAVDAGCTSSLRDPDSSSTYYARRHTFTLSAAATVSVWVGPASSSSYLVLSDSSGKVVGRDQGNDRSCYRNRCTYAAPARLDHLLLAAGTYTIEATKSSPGATGAYTVGARWAPADACSRSLGALGEGSSSLSGSGIVAVDAGCTSSLRDPDSSSTYYARRHTFTLSAAATVSVWVGPASSSSYLVLSDSSGKVVGRDQGNDRSCYRNRCTYAAPARLDHLLLAAGTYTIEATKSSPGATGAYTVGARWAPADACSRSLGALGEGSSSLSGSGIVAVDAGCTSSLRDPDSSSTYYARRHTFTLSAAATVSVWVGPASSSSYLVLSDSSGKVVGRDQGNDRSCYRNRCTYAAPARLDHLLLAAGTYTIEATKSSPGATGAYTVGARWAPLPLVVSSAAAREDDGAVVFTVVAPEGRESPISVDYATVDGTAVAGGDFTAVSGTVTIPAEARYATVSVPLVDDSAAEGDESFTLALSNPKGAALSSASAAATVSDDDGPPERAAGTAVAACAGTAVEGGVTGVFDVSQSGFAGWRHVFVDVEVDCGSAGTNPGYRTRVEVIGGPSARNASSRHCLARPSLDVAATETHAIAGGCGVSASPDSGGAERVERSVHVLRVRDNLAGRRHQMRAWVDLDDDGVFELGEPYDVFASDFSARSQANSALSRRAAPESVRVVVLPGSTRMGRAGQYSELRLRLVEPRIVGAVGTRPIEEERPLAHTPVGAKIASGPSRRQAVTCAGAGSAAPPGERRQCLTDSEGVFTVRWQVASGGAHLFAVNHDEVAVFVDRNRNGRHDNQPNHPAPEPSFRIEVPIAKAINYIALGDSYSSGENGRPGSVGFTGAYLTDNPAAAECNRWDKAYPVVFATEFLGGIARVEVAFDTYACTGAVAHNIYNPADPHGTSTDDYNHQTDRPSNAAALDEPVYETVSRQDPKTMALTMDRVFHARDPRWEPRQAASLKQAQAGLQQRMQNVDIITLTIGGNDMGFAAVLKACAYILDSSCNHKDILLKANELEKRLVPVLQHLKKVAPKASIFVMGYPYVTPVLGVCPDTSRETVERYIELILNITDYNEQLKQAKYRRRKAQLQEKIDTATEETLTLGIDAVCMGDIYNFAVTIYDCPSLSAEEIHSSYSKASINIGKLASWFGRSFLPERLRIDPGEAVFLAQSANRVNLEVRRAAEKAGVHFVDVLRGDHLAGSDSSFVGHSPCANKPWLNGFIVDDGVKPIPVSGRSFHPNADGHGRYAEILDRYIRHVVAGGAELNQAGLPVNPEPAESTSSESEFYSGGDQQDPPESSDGGEKSGGSVAVLAWDRAVGSGCGAPFVAPGARVTLKAGGFAANSTVSVSARSVSLGDTKLGPLTVPDVTADGDGEVTVAWTVPAAPTAAQDAAPRAYVLNASGTGAGGGSHEALMVEPVVAYPGTAPCAMADSARTQLGRPVRIRLLDNDTAPTGGTLDAGAVRVVQATGGEFTMGAAGAATFTPEPGFSGTARARYWVYDGWGIGVAGDIEVVVDAGCTVTGRAGVERIEGTDGDDVICVPDPEDRRAFHVIDAKGGDDVILGGDGVDWINAGGGDDTVYGRGGDDRVHTGSGTDTVYGGPGVDVVHASSLEDTVHDDPGGAEVLIEPSAVAVPTAPVASDDWHYVDPSAVAVIDVLGNDVDADGDLAPSTLQVTKQPPSGTTEVVAGVGGTGPAVRFTAAQGSGTVSFAYRVCDGLGACSKATVTIMVGTSGCTITGSPAAETLRGTPGNDVICGGGGDDTIYGLGGNDVIIAGDGDDVIYGGKGRDIIWAGSGGDTVRGGDNNDTVWAGEGDDRVWGEAGKDRLHGGGGDDILWGGDNDDRLHGGGGDDTLWGGAGDDVVGGGDGDDTADGGDDNDAIYGGGGADTLKGRSGNDALRGGPGNDTVEGGGGDDRLWGDSGDDRLRGGDNDDTIWGGLGDDWLWGGKGKDLAYGGPGDDNLDGGPGGDYLNGGDGTDACANAAARAECETRQTATRQ
ncbi:Ig-like domain-containing protein [Candidatus Poriferisocius sp.]|uniref:Ig-like domain-containing protein n=1 Tax=Candidatus Poriferisocius sp. TaxID=3101276 RepID=UPI003B01BF25